MPLKCYYNKPAKPGVSRETLINIIRKLHENKNAPLTNADFVGAAGKNLEPYGRVPTRTTFSKWLGHSLNEACARAGVPFEGRK